PARRRETPDTFRCRHRQGRSMRRCEGNFDMHSSFRYAARAAAGLSALLLVTTSPLMAHDYKAGDLDLVHPWSRETPQGAKVAAGYVRIVNNGSEADRLVAVS